ncbi:rhomboid family intramembrane serine protease [Sphingomonas sp.]|uniref:rhomboid family intramembrane serine protease n=1 Tax=Sphingomonas sp. TaxID=28214 RepID=UPI003B3AEAA1
MIRSCGGAWRDVVPVYSAYQLVFNVIGLAFLMALWAFFGVWWPVMLVPALLAWVYQYRLRPAHVDISAGQADRLMTLMRAQNIYARSDWDGRWRATGRSGWEPWPHCYVAFVPHPEGMTVTAPHNVLERLWLDLAVVEEDGLEATLRDHAAPEDEEEPATPLPWTAHGPGALIGAFCIVAWLAHPGRGMASWGVSAQTLAQGRFQTVLLHMFAHGNLIHLLLNMVALAAFGGPLMVRMGTVPQNWLRFLSLFLCSGLAGAVCYLLFHPSGAVPMIGASGALYGVIGLLIRAPADQAPLLPLGSPQLRKLASDLIKSNAFLWVLLSILSVGPGGGLAWEAHMGGFLFGLLIGPFFLPNRRDRAKLADAAQL